MGSKSTAPEQPQPTCVGTLKGKQQDYGLVTKIGQGAFGEVWKVFGLKDKKIYAAKRVRQENTDTTDLLNEIKLLQEINSPLIVQIMDVPANNNEMFYIMEYCGKGDLRTLIFKNKQKVEFPVLMDWFIQILEAVEVLHSKKVIHRDIKLDNIFCTEDGKIKLGDLGISRTVESASANAFMTLAGTVVMMAPELRGGGAYNSSIDIWSLGIVLLQVAASVEFVPPEFLYLGLLDSLVTKFGLNNTSTHVLLGCMLKLNSKERSTASQLMKHGAIKSWKAIMKKESAIPEAALKDENFIIPFIDALTYPSTQEVAFEKLLFLLTKEKSYIVNLLIQSTTLVPSVVNVIVKNDIGEGLSRYGCILLSVVWDSVKKLDYKRKIIKACDSNVVALKLWLNGVSSSLVNVIIHKYSTEAKSIISKLITLDDTTKLVQDLAIFQTAEELKPLSKALNTGEEAEKIQRAMNIANSRYYSPTLMIQLGVVKVLVRAFQSKSIEIQTLALSYLVQFLIDSVNASKYATWNQVCSIKFLGPTFCSHLAFACRTCFKEETATICTSCAIKCHNSHEIIVQGFLSHYCDCGVKASCQCLGDEIPLVKKLEASAITGEGLLTGLTAENSTTPIPVLKTSSLHAPWITISNTNQISYCPTDQRRLGISNPIVVGKKQKGNSEAVCYFEITFVSVGRLSVIGFKGAQSKPDEFPGYSTQKEIEDWGWHSDDGVIYSQKKKELVCVSYDDGDTVGIGITKENVMFFTLNGGIVGWIRNIPVGVYHPSLSTSSLGKVVPRFSSNSWAFNPNNLADQIPFLNADIVKEYVNLKLCDILSQSFPDIDRDDSAILMAITFWRLLSMHPNIKPLLQLSKVESIIRKRIKTSSPYTIKVWCKNLLGEEIDIVNEDNTVSPLNTNPKASIPSDELQSVLKITDLNVNAKNIDTPPSSVVLPQVISTIESPQKTINLPLRVVFEGQHEDEFEIELDYLTIGDMRTKVIDLLKAINEDIITTNLKLTFRKEDGDRLVILAMDTNIRKLQRNDKIRVSFTSSTQSTIEAKTKIFDSKNF